MHEWLIYLLQEYSSWAPHIIFLALVVAAFNIPISEDLTAIAAGMLVMSLARPEEQLVAIHIALIDGAVVGDMIVYLIGYTIGQPLLNRPFFQRILNKKYQDQLSRYFYKHATLTILIGRFIPFGVRNSLSLFSGITRLNPFKFLLLDTLSASISISVIYYLSQHYSKYILQNLRTAQLLLLLVVIGIIAFIVFKFYKRSRRLKKTDLT